MQSVVEVVVVELHYTLYRYPVVLEIPANAQLIPLSRDYKTSCYFTCKTRVYHVFTTCLPRANHVKTYAAIVVTDTQFY